MSVENAIIGTLRSFAMRTGRGHRWAEQRPEDNFGAFLDRGLRRGSRALRGAAIVLHDELDIGRAEFREREIGGVFHGLRDGARIAARAERQNERDARRRSAERRRLDAGFARLGLNRRAFVLAEHAAGSVEEQPASTAPASRSGIAATRARMSLPRHAAVTTDFILTPGLH